MSKETCTPLSESDVFDHILLIGQLACFPELLPPTKRFIKAFEFNTINRVHLITTADQIIDGLGERK